jgi:hypothetical protein
MKTYEGHPHRNGAYVTIIDDSADGGPIGQLPLHTELQRYASHIAWGAQIGGAPTGQQLAFALLYEVFRDRHRAMKLSERFRDHIIAAMPADSEWSLTEDAIRRIAESMERLGFRTGDGNSFGRPLVAAPIEERV